MKRPIDRNHSISLGEVIRSDTVYSIASFLTILSLLLGWKVFQHVDKEGIPLDFTPQSIFLDDGEMVQQLRLIEEEFGREDNDFLILLKGERLTQDTGKEWLQTVHNKMEQVEGVTKVLSLVNAPYIKGRWISGSWYRLGTTDTLGKLYKHSLCLKLLSNESGTVQVIQVRVEKEREKVSELQPSTMRSSTLFKIIRHQRVSTGN